MQELIQNLAFNTSLDATPVINILNKPYYQTSDEQMQTSLQNMKNSQFSSIISQPSIHQNKPEVADNQLNMEIKELTNSQVDRINHLASIMVNQNTKENQHVNQIVKTLETENNTLQLKLRQVEQELQMRLDNQVAANKDQELQIERLSGQNKELAGQLLQAQQEKLKLQLQVTQLQKLCDAHGQEKAEYQSLTEKVTKRVDELQSENSALREQLEQAERGIQRLVEILEENGVLSPRQPAAGMSGTAVFQPQQARMLRKCAACNQAECKCSGAERSGDRASKVLRTLKEEQRELQEDLSALVADAYANPGRLCRNIDRVQTLIRQQHRKTQSVKRLQQYRRQVGRLGVSLK